MQLRPPGIWSKPKIDMYSAARRVQSIAGQATGILSAVHAIVYRDLPLNVDTALCARDVQGDSVDHALNIESRSSSKKNIRNESIGKFLSPVNIKKLRVRKNHLRLSICRHLKIIGEDKSSNLLDFTKRQGSLTLKSRVLIRKLSCCSAKSNRSSNLISILPKLQNIPFNKRLHPVCPIACCFGSRFIAERADQRRTRSFLFHGLKLTRT